MKPIISNDLRKRITVASQNGSIIAADLLNAIKKCKNMGEETDKKSNYFDSRRIVSSHDGRKTIRIVVTCCNKDINHPSFPDRGNPSAPYLPDNRTQITICDFAKLFKSVRENYYEEHDWDYFDSAVRVSSKITIRVGTTISDFIRAYLVDNYINISQSSESPLHSSCMRHEGVVQNVADFYKNFAGCKILIAETAEGEVCARAILWDGVRHYDHNYSFVDRIYTAFDPFLIPMMKKAAAEKGYLLCKTYNDFSHKKIFTFINQHENNVPGDNITLVLIKDIPAVKEHKRGAPYVDTMSHVCYKDGSFFLSNEEDDIYTVATLSSTGGYAHLRHYICPSCGKIHDSNYSRFCNDCKNENLQETDFGVIFKNKTVKYKDSIVPAFFIKKGAPTPSYKAYLIVKKLMTC